MADKKIINDANVGKTYKGRKYNGQILIPNVPFELWKQQIDEMVDSPFSNLASILRFKISKKYDALKGN